MVAGTSKKLWWRCLENPDHEWHATGSNRLRSRRCPLCRKSLRSTLEIGLVFELQTLVSGLDLSDDKVVVAGVVRHVDLLLRQPRVVIEVDGRYHHDGEAQYERDAAKSRLLEDAGYRVLRLREKPLQPISPHDVLLPRDPTIKQATDAALVRLTELGWLPLPGARQYLKEDEARRQEEALNYVRTSRPGKTVRAPGPVSFTRQERWQGGLSELLQYVEDHGHSNVPYEHFQNGFPLGKWVGAKRAQYKRGRLALPRQRVLSALPGWTWDAVEESWEVGYQRLLAYEDREGHIRVPVHYKDDDGYPLGQWLRSHRRPDGGRRTLTELQRLRLEALPGWTYEASKDVFWERAATALEAFSAREGHCQTPRGHREQRIDIDSWIRRQRAVYHDGDLDADQAARLERLPGWSWSPQQDAWERGFAAISAFVTAHGSAAVRSDESLNGYPIGAWVREQRNRRTQGTLDPTRHRRLEALPGWSWSPLAETWESYFAALQQFVAREGHARVPTNHTEAGMPLASWVIRHRQEFKAGKVPPDRVARLEALPNWTWDVLAARWEEHFEALVKYTEREGHARVPQHHDEDGLGLGRWVIVQRQANRKGELSDERANRLAALPGWAWDMRDVAWEMGLTALVDFQARTGHCRVPSAWLEDGYRLGQWVGVQRGLFLRGKLRADRAERLLPILEP